MKDNQTTKDFLKDKKVCINELQKGRGKCEHFYGHDDKYWWINIEDVLKALSIQKKRVKGIINKFWKRHKICSCKIKELKIEPFLTATKDDIKELLKEVDKI